MTLTIEQIYKIEDIIVNLTDEEKDELFFRLKKNISFHTVRCPNCGSKNFYQYKNGGYRCQRCSTKYE